MINRTLIESCIRIRNLDEFKPFREWLQQMKDAEMAVLVGAQDEVTMRLAQGAVRTIQRVIDQIEGSAKALDKARQ